MFSDRFLYGKFLSTLVLLWGSCFYARWRAEELYPSLGQCLREPVRHEGRVLGLRAMPVDTSESGKTVIYDRDGIRIEVLGAGDPEWAGQYVSFVARFVGAHGEEPAHLEILRDKEGRPRARLEGDFPKRRRWMYGVSLLVAAMGVLLFARAFAWNLPWGIFRKRGGP